MYSIVYCNDDKKGRLKTLARFSLLVKMSSSMTDGIRVLDLLLPILGLMIVFEEALILSDMYL